MRVLRCVAALKLVMAAGLSAQGVTGEPAKVLPVPAHEANFAAERNQANELFLAGKALAALPLYEDLCRQDQTIAVFAERHAVGLFTREATAPADESATLHAQAMAELRRAQSLGDDSPLLQNLSSMADKGPLGALLSGVSLSASYAYQGNGAAQEPMRGGEAAFSRGDYAAAIPLYEQAVAADPGWYEPPLTLGDTYFRLNDWTKAGEWFKRAIAIDPDRDTAYRYWGDALYKSGDPLRAKLRYEQAVVAEPYERTGWNALGQWLRLTHSTMRPWPEVVRPPWTTQEGALRVDPSLLVESGDGHASWLIYERRRVALGAPVPIQTMFGGSVDTKGLLTAKGYRHSLAEETDALEAMLADVRAKLANGTVTKDKLEPSLGTLLELDRQGWLECWIMLRGADAGIRYDYPAFRASHRDLLVRYVDSMVVSGAV